MTGTRSGGPVAAIDIGTNTALVLVARRDERGGLRVLEDRCATPRLGQGLATSGALSDAAIERTLDVLRGYLALVEERGVAPDALRVAGTAVLRRAKDAARFLRRVREELGVAVDVLSEEDEARIGYQAVAGASPDALVVDVGGGSSELVLDGGTRGLSAPIGAVVLTESCLGDAAPATPEGWARLLAVVEEACRVFPAGAAASRDRDVVLLGGTGVNLACLDLGLAAFDAQAAEGHRLDAVRAGEWAARLAGLAAGSRESLPIEASRALILPAGLACVAGVLGRIGAPSARVSGRGLRYGLARGLLERAGVG